MSDKYFKKALADFTIDFASGDAIRALADKGYSVSEIHKRLDFPTPVERIRNTVWKHYIDTGVIVLEKPSDNLPKKHVTYEKVQDSLGRTSFRQVVTEDNNTKEYVEIDFGKRIYQNKNTFEKALEILSPEDRQYILDLPWPLTNVWHVKNERMERILKKLK
ncbi:MAG: hypothetical protein IKZ39_05225 [Lachnospiraceae bacterium]|nr:hypothetical protein [Lachnospiraceae bacterium]